MEEPTNKITLPDPIQNIHDDLDVFSSNGTKIPNWMGNKIIISLFYLYLLNKYKSNCLLYFKFEKRYNLGLELRIRSYENLSESNIIKIQKEDDRYYKAISTNLINCIKRPDVNIIIIPMCLYFFEDEIDLHANVLIYRKEFNQIEHFEPHGSFYSGSSIPVYKKISYELKSRFIHILNTKLKKERLKPVTLIGSCEICPYSRGLQQIEELAPNKLKEEGLGYCGAWSLFFTELALKNPTIPSHKLFKIIYKRINGEDGANYLRQIIRGYVNLMAEKIKTYYSILFGEKISINYIHHLHRNIDNLKYQTKLVNIREYFFNIASLEMEIFNNPSFNKETKLREVEEELLHTTDPLKQKYLQQRIDILNNIDVLLHNTFDEKGEEIDIYELFEEKSTEPTGGSRRSKTNSRLKSRLKSKSRTKRNKK